VILFVSDKSEEVSELSGVILSELLKLNYEARIQLPGPSNKLIDDLELFANFVELYQ
jgi:hypothetical protein